MRGARTVLRRDVEILRTLIVIVVQPGRFEMCQVYQPNGPGLFVRFPVPLIVRNALEYLSRALHLLIKFGKH